MYDKNRSLDIASKATPAKKRQKSATARIYVTPPVPMKDLEQGKLDGFLVKTKRAAVEVIHFGLPKIPEQREQKIDKFVAKTKRVTVSCPTVVAPLASTSSRTKNRKLKGSTIDGWLVPLPCERQFFGSSCPSRSSSKRSSINYTGDVIFRKKTGRKRLLYRRGKLNSRFFVRAS